jgi:ferredoxin
MKTIIYWFSGTGNSLHVAKALEAGLEETVLVHASAALEGTMETVPRTGLVFPVYSWGPPALMERLIGELPSEKPGYMFAVATYGGAPGSTMKITRKMLERRGLSLDASFTVKMVENYPPMGGAPSTEKQQIVLDEAEKEIPAIVRGIREGVTGDHGSRSFFFSLIGPMIYPYFRKSVNRAAGKFSADESCTSCGICARVCPVSNVEVPGGERPVWGKRCEQCFACLHWCPEEAVQYGKKSRGQPRYHHPGVTLREMIPKKSGENPADPPSGG